MPELLLRSPPRAPFPRSSEKLEEALRVLKKLLLAALAAGTLAAVRKRSSGKAESDLWHEATRGPGAVSTPTAP